MNEPYKVIYKYKNNKLAIKYHILIFIGNLIDDKIIKILNIIKNINLYDSLISITDEQNNLLINEYGIYWYKYFFITSHIQFTIDKIKNNIDLQKILKDKYGEEWYNIHINDYIEINKKSYSFQNQFKLNNKLKANIKNKQDDIIDELENFEIQNGGNNLDNENIEINNEILDDINDLDNNNEFNIEDLDNMINEELNVINNTNIENILKKYEDKKYVEDLLKIQDWDKLNDDNIVSDNLKDIFKKTYIYNQYIFNDDTILNIKKKICCGIKKNSFYKNDDYLIPSRIYLWSNYYYKQNNNIKLEKIMLGHKWINKTELLNIDIEPSDKMYNYENLTGNLKLLQDNIKKYSSKISFEDDNYNIIDDYDNFIQNNEIYMIDIYNELGINYKNDNEKTKNVYDTYVKIYYPFIIYNDFLDIINYLNNIKIDIEINKINIINNTIKNDLINENEIIKIIEEYKKQPELYKNISHDNNIINAVIHINIIYNNYNNYNNKLELFRIFDNFITDEKYPFIQYQTLDDKIIFKIYDKKENYNKDNLNQKWFENTPYGINFKIINNNKVMAISLNENGKIYYKIQWKEIENATFEDIHKSFDDVRFLLKKINSENEKFNINIPNDNDFRYGFLNSTLKFTLPEKFMISHNDLSDFSRLFYPYLSVVIEPKKRTSNIKKNSDFSKYGTYLKYKRMSKYDNEINIDKRILYFLKNYEFNQKLLTEQISKEFNITEEIALNKIINIINKFPKIKKSRKILKKLEIISNKYKSPGVGIHIMGKKKDNYKIIITGVKSKKQLDNIIKLINIILYLYIETYLYKKKDKQFLLKKLIELKNIAKRRNKVNDIINIEENISDIKKMKEKDKERLGFKSDKGENNWGRLCQNSGKIKRRPLILNDDNIKDLINLGYTYNNKTKNYELKTTIKTGNSKKDIILSVAKIDDKDGNNVYYTCNPKENGEYMYIGFLSKSKNPYGLCMPCCYKKNMALSVNKEIKNFHNKCIGCVDIENRKIDTEKIYILDSNKIQDNRFSYLPKYLDLFFNINLNKKKVIKNNYFISSNTGYFFKYGFNQDDDIYLTAISICLDISIDNIKSKISDILLNDKNRDNIFYYLNNGDISLQFKTIENYLRHIYFNFEIDYELINDMISIENVLIKEGLNIYILEKNDDDYNIIINNYENINLYNDKNRKNIILIKNENNYYPIFLIKKNENDKNIILQKVFNSNDDIIINLYNFLLSNTIKFNLNNNILLNTKETYEILKKYKYDITYQIIDKRNKIKYLIINNKYLINVKPSGALYNIKINKEYDKYLQNLDDTIKFIYELYNKTNKELKIKPSGLYYTDKDNGLEINSIMINNMNIPVIKQIITKNEIYEYAKITKNKHFIIEHQPILDIIDNYLDNKEYIIDKRILKVKKDMYNNEMFELFRYELSNYLIINDKIKMMIIDIKNSDINKELKKNQIKKILYKICSDKLFNLFNEINNIEIKGLNKIMTKLVNISNDKIIYDNYELDNYRKLCKINDTKDKCKLNKHCSWDKNNCNLMVDEINLIRMINKVVDEIINNLLRGNEILNIDNYYISDIINKLNFINRDDQILIKSNNNNMKKIFSDIFGLNSVPIIGKKKFNTKSLSDEIQPIEIIGKNKYQKIININVIYRCYANSYYWINTLIKDEELKNLGYYSILQTDLCNYFKSQIIEWINYKNNYLSIINLFKKILNLSKNFLSEFKTYLTKSNECYYNYIIELYILFIINKNPIIIYDKYDNIIVVFDDNYLFIKNYIGDKNNLKKYNNIDMITNYIKIKYNIDDFSITNNPSILYVIY